MDKLLKNLLLSINLEQFIQLVKDCEIDTSYDRIVCVNNVQESEKGVLIKFTYKSSTGIFYATDVYVFIKNDNLYLQF